MFEIWLSSWLMVVVGKHIVNGSEMTELLPLSRSIRFGLCCLQERLR